MWRVVIALVSVALVAAAAVSRVTAGSAPSTSASTPTAPRAFTRIVHAGSYRLDLRLAPNRAGSISTVSVRLTRDGLPVNRARVTFTTLMAKMPMGYTGRLPQTAPGRYVHRWPSLMRGPWKLRYEIAPPRGKPFGVTVVDRVA
jgi:hypothetical protein